MKRAAAVCLLLILAGCVASPAPTAFDSPLAVPMPRRSFVPLAIAGQGKVGVGVDRAYADCKHIAQLGARWYYDWSPQPIQCPGAEAVPMLWAPGDGVTNPPIASRYLLLLNECDRPDQCNTPPEAAAVAWRGWEQQYPDRLLVGPNTSRAGMEWLLAWHAAYIRLYGEQPRMWALGIHCYNPAGWCEDWTTANIALAREWTQSGQVWITEWSTTGCYYSQPRPDSVDAALLDAARLQAWFEAQPEVARTAWFVTKLPGICQTALIGPDDRLTPFGLWYQTLAENGP
jgi:hypothetical protein